MVRKGTRLRFHSGAATITHSQSIDSPIHRSWAYDGPTAIKLDPGPVPDPNHRPVNNDVPFDPTGTLSPPGSQKWEQTEVRWACGHDARSDLRLRGSIEIWTQCFLATIKKKI